AGASPDEDEDAVSGAEPESPGAAEDSAASGAGADVAGASELAAGVSGAVESAPLSQPARPNNPATRAARSAERTVFRFMRSLSVIVAGCRLKQALRQKVPV